ncbi:MAG: N(4)-(beta-N-acetylglucosaminyl)-L-asparaginase [Algoriphagus sp.]|jgi:N4-(beta-N-acetylglucosaminyl)-L-asparaginase|uniref:isoaspartyl peptidase/L-asparaginase family protein n=1 Tax=Algoriphagus sp. TaxID=1872435 RepID=UPI00274AA086|nr:N(4)-(beta-N-acetylglucosaminyl)-L-asparaginase [Algoriphagus sp.]MDP4747275.1 N(4)-(beta-N-acetylglucosaminyl)-L-asparaginase [Algoriphagus sp.]MDP4838499.1 N(4)-(beta-N-acetylglucosaminyl)-L-asparaginase [Algoriphagus sp.]MDP4904722.1 N(4)-(beta-N-acetylglucosaminyl)-L-asparaginase [Algoriphagus sp.]MDP4956397.1 N(4)-(beta-N-acetylglucosaminyl)-L-asparaginase [Algoriphagus sp.]
MSQRRKFIKQSLLGSALLIPGLSTLKAEASPIKKNAGTKPIILSTWNHGVPANADAWAKLKETGSILDAVEAGVRNTELDLENLSVGLQGLPDREGITTLDASIMLGDGSCGSVAFVRQVKHPISLARAVMEKTPHVMLAGEGARQFAIAQGFPMEEEKLSPKAQEEYDKWKVTSQYKPIINVENHDTIGMIGLDASGKLAGSCTTSGLAYKMHGRIGDSPIIGAGLFVDNEVGAATATGLGESIIRICGSFLIVELMRQGRSPQAACEEAVRRLVAKNRNIKDIQAGFLAINKEGEVGAFAVHPGFNYAQATESGNVLIDSASHFKA